ncbi:HEAT repeat domain-containing protein [Mastigocladopsis repens]|uniref:HEAT repeat domain-containing protein n=1 Tax=Mastigocladopsis repens TaxID=221287 RepID=UPI000366930A|nr:HEAT repeat domain-containing protein [Mastigocladopsis repens]
MIEPKFVGEIVDYLMAQNGEAEKFSNLFLAAKCLTDVRNRKEIVKTAHQLLNCFKDLTKYDLNYYYDPSRDVEETKLVQEIRTQAVAAIAITWKDDATTLPWLKQRATADYDSYVRGAAVQALASNFKDDKDTLPILKSRATADDDKYVRRAAVQALGKWFKDEPELFDIYYNCAVNDPFKRKENDETNPRRIALEIIVKQHPHHPQTLPLLRDRAENDPDEKVREFAQKKLREWGE